MKKLVDKSVYLNTLKQLTNFAILVLAIGIISILFSHNVYGGGMSEDLRLSMAYNLIDNAIILVVIIGSPLLSIMAVRFAWSKKRSDFIYSMPTTKGGIFVSKALAVVSVETAIILIVNIVGILLSARYLGRVMFAGDLVLGFVNALLASMIIISAVFLAISVTGKVLSSALLSIGIIGIPMIFSEITKYSLQRTMFFNQTGISHVPSLYLVSNVFTYGVSLIESNSYYIPSLIFTFALVAVYFVLGYILFKKRSGELTGRYSNSKIVHYITMAVAPTVIITMAVTRSAGYGLFSGNMYMQFIQEPILMLVAGLIFAFAYDTFVHKKLRKNNRCIWLFALVVLVILGTSYLIDAGVKKADRIVINADEVESVNVITDGEILHAKCWPNETTYGEQAAGEVLITDKDVIAEFANAYNERINKYEYDDSYVFKMVKFNIEKGRPIYKVVPIHIEYDEKTNEIKENADTMLMEITDYAQVYFDNMPVEHVTNLSIDHEYLSEEQKNIMLEVYKVFAEEYEQLPLEKKVYIKGRGDFAWVSGRYPFVSSDNEEDSHFIGKLYVRGRVKGENIVDIYYITKDTPKAYNAYMEALNRISLEKLKEYINKYVSDPTDNYLLHRLEIFFVDMEEYSYAVNLNRHVDKQRELLEKASTILKDNDFETPTIEDNIIKVGFTDWDYGTTRYAYLKVSDDELNKLDELYREFVELIGK